jgi:peptidyl-prolyl cis-trans isomerase B (cyclophilin B)
VRIHHKLALVLLGLSVLLPATSLAKGRRGKKRPVVELSISSAGKSWGKIQIQLFPAKAPKSVANFLKYVRARHYDGTIFHRVIENFMIQGGGFTDKYEKKETQAPVKNEADNGLKNERGTVAMARTSDPHSASAQFFINVKSNTFLNHRSKSIEGWGYCVFGKVIRGMKVVDRIKKVSTGSAGPFTRDAPQTAVVISKAKVL